MKKRIFILIWVAFMLLFSSCKKNKKLTLTAVQKYPEDTITLEFDYQERIERLEASKYPGLIFSGWFKDEDFKTRVTFPFEIKEDTVIFGYWIDEFKYEYDFNEKTCKVVDVLISSTLQEVPAYSNGCKVIEIKSHAFYGNTKLESITLPDTIEVIGDEAFKGCTSLKTVKLSKNLKKIGSGVFDGDQELKYNNVLGCMYLDNYLIKVEGIVKDKLYITSGTLGIFPDAFSSDLNITTLVLPSTLSFIDSTTLSELKKLEQIEVDEENLSYSSSFGVLFNKDKTILLHYPRCLKKSVYEIEKTVKIINDYAFSFNEYLTEVICSFDLEKIMRCAFYKCSNLQNIILSNTLQEISDYAFAYTSLNKLNIPSSVKAIGAEILSGNKQITELSVPYAYKDGKSYPISSYFSSEKSIPQSLYFLSITGGEVILEDTLRGLSSLVELKLGDQIKTIAPGAFKELKSLTNLDLSQNQNFIYSGKALYTLSYQELIWVNNKAATVFYVDSRVKKIASYAFNYLDSLKEIWLNDNLEEISMHAFVNMGSLKKLVIKENIKKIEQDICMNTPNVTIYVKCKYFTSDVSEGWNTYNYPVVWDAHFPTIILESTEYYVFVGDEFKINYRVEDVKEDYNVILEAESLALIDISGFNIVAKDEGIVVIALYIEGYPDSKVFITIIATKKSD